LQGLADANDGVQRLQFGQQQQHRQVIAEWLSPSNFPQQKTDYLERRQEGTGLWLIKSDQFKQWTKGSQETLVCPGIPGSGKTILASIVIDHLERNLQNETVGVAYIYCSYKSQQTLANLLGSILKQLAQNQTAPNKGLEKLYQDHRKKGTSPAFTELKEQFLPLMEPYSRVFVIVDALDECANKDERTRLISTLHDLQKQRSLNLMVTCRDIPDVTAVAKANIRLDICADNADINLYLSERMHRLAKCVKKSKNLQEEIKQEIIGAVNGM